MAYIEVAQARDTLTGCLEALRTLVDGLDHVQGCDLSDLAATASQVSAVARGLMVATTAEASARGVVAESGSLTPATWLQDQRAALNDPETYQVQRAIEQTRARELAPLREALVAGEISPADACTAARVFHELRTATDPGMHTDLADGVLTLARTGLSRRALHRFKKEVLARYGTLDDEQRNRDHGEARRGVSGWRLLEDGLWGIEGVFDGADKAILDAALTALSAPAPDNREGELDYRSPRQRRADALVTMARQVAAAQTTGPMGATCQVSLILPPEALARPCEHRAVDAFGLYLGTPAEPCDCPRSVASTDGLGTTLLPEQARELSCGAAITPVVLGEAGQPLAVGRTRRLATAGQRTVLAARDGGCSFPGCTRPPSWTEAHHIVHWADGGPTDVTNLALLCGRHHRFIHQHSITGRVVADGSRVVWDVINTASGWRPREPGWYPDPGPDAVPSGRAGPPEHDLVV
ncbi:HNH endonuclease signature motif containing protein [Arsenicicoccus sp. oral taxon 190]|uniref:HNH endonuclease signature motif containing protein n=1 Tax=Arsenicicoccus sp. oral taxon 190 TaxID=1658671 RepID=UPI00067A883D|nr:HNH endonuclease signature motif containing protein [Arsenicicoccus sp. oral taxon 190]